MMLVWCTTETSESLWKGLSRGSYMYRCRAHVHESATHAEQQVSLSKSLGFV